MTPESEAELYARHPRLLVYPPGQGSHLPMHFGIECGDGWLTLIDCLLYSASIHTDVDDEPPAVLQIKQKFGSLRVYWRGANDAVQGMTQFAGELSRYICEVCGLPGSLGTDGPRYLRVRCDAHRDVANPDDAYRSTAEDQIGRPLSEALSAEVELTERQLQDAALLLSMERGGLTVALLQRRFKIGYRRAQELLGAVMALRAEQQIDGSE